MFARRTGRVAWAVVLLAGTAAARAERADDVMHRPGLPLHASPAARLARRILFVNRGGGTYRPSTVNDAATNESSVVGCGHGREPLAVPSSSLGDADWATLMACVRDSYAPYALEVTDREPAAGDHLEVVVTGLPADIGCPEDNDDWAGVAPRTACAGQIDERDVVFAFERNTYDLDDLCWTITHEAGHAFGLDYELRCHDPMSYEDGCLPKRFVDDEVACGEEAPRPCRCDGNGAPLGPTQNSHRVLLDRLGPADRVPPAVSLLAPAGGATVKAGFVVEGAAADDAGVAEVELLLDGSVADVARTPPYRFGTARHLALGAHTLQLAAHDEAGNRSESPIVDVTVEPQCREAGDCPTGQACFGRVCGLELGSACARDDDCGAGVCATVAGVADATICTAVCAGLSGAKCPDGFICRAQGAGPARCAPFADGCAVGADRRRGSGVMVLLAVGLLGLWARRHLGA